MIKNIKKSQFILSLAEKIFEREYNRFRKTLGYLPHELVDQSILTNLAHKFYHSRVEGGEGHLEVGKSIYYTEKSFVSYDSLFETVWLHAINSIGWCSVCCNITL